MKKSFTRFAGIAVLILFAGCDLLTSSGEKAIREVLNASKDLRDTLQSVQDANSAQAAAEVLDAKYARLIASLRDFAKHTQDKVLKSTLDDLTRQLQEVQSQLKAEGERVTKIRGLPLSFWKIAKVRSGEIMEVSLELMNTTSGIHLPGDAIAAIHELQGLWTTHGYESVIQIELENLPLNLSQKAYDKIQQAAPGAKVLHFSLADKCTVGLGPVQNYKTFLTSLDLGAVTFEDEPQRTIHITVDRRKLGAHGNSDAEESQFRQQEFEERAKKQREEAAALATLHQLEAEQRRLEREQEMRGPDRSDPQYFEKLAERMAGSDHFRKTAAIDALLSATPADVPSAETRKLIARNFKKLAESDDHFSKEKAIKGLVIWGGKFSVPILLKMLDGSDRMNQKEIIQALGELGDPQAAEAVAARLGDFFTHETAYNALKQMGAAAEDALIAVGPSNNPKICLAAINLLGDAGTDKSFPFLREAQTSRNVEVRNAAKAAMRKIVARKNKSAASKP
jgi:hypothetical protein